MRNRFLPLLGLSLVVSNYAMAATATPTVHTNSKNTPVKLTPLKPKLITENDKLSYTLGVQLGIHLKREGIAINSNLFAAGLRDANQG